MNDVLESYKFINGERIDYQLLNSEIVKRKVIQDGVPIVISNTTKDWKTDIFTPQWIKDKYSNLEITVRIDGDSKNTEHWTVGQYIDYLNKMSSNNNNNQQQSNNNQQQQSININSNNINNNNINNNQNNNNQNTIPSSFYYRKDIPCPPEWTKYIEDYNKLYGFLREKDSGDLVCDLPLHLQPNSTHICIDGSDYWSPGQREVAGSIGYNLMVYNGGTSKTYWFCTSSKDFEEASKFWKNKTGVPVDNDAKQMFIRLDDLSKATFPVYFMEQKQGDLVVIPPGSIYQYFNVGGKSMKLSWNRMNYQNLELSYRHILPIYRSIKKKEHFPVKSIAFHSLINRLSLADECIKTQSNQLLLNIEVSKEIFTLLKIVSNIQWCERVDLTVMSEERISSDEKVESYNDLNFKKICIHCNGFIFNRAYLCKECQKEKSPFSSLICIQCISEGTCKHKSQTLMESIPCQTMESIIENAKKILQSLCALIERLGSFSPVNLDELNNNGNIYGLSPTQVSPGTIAFNQVVLFQEDQKATCHQCKLARPRNKIAYCHKKVEEHGKKRKSRKMKCQKKFCSQCLWNRYQVQLVDCLSQRKWECLFCLNKCNCSACNRKRSSENNNGNGGKELSSSSSCSSSTSSSSVNHNHQPGSPNSGSTTPQTKSPSKLSPFVTSQNGSGSGSHRHHPYYQLTSNDPFINYSPPIKTEKILNNNKQSTSTTTTTTTATLATTAPTKNNNNSSSCSNNNIQVKVEPNNELQSSFFNNFNQQQQASPMIQTPRQQPPQPSPQPPQPSPQIQPPPLIYSNQSIITNTYDPNQTTNSNIYYHDTTNNYNQYIQHQQQQQQQALINFQNNPQFYPVQYPLSTSYIQFHQQHQQQPYVNQDINNNNNIQHQQPLVQIPTYQQFQQQQHHQLQQQPQHIKPNLNTPQQQFQNYNNNQTTNINNKNNNNNNNNTNTINNHDGNSNFNTPTDFLSNGSSLNGGGPFCVENQNQNKNIEFNTIYIKSEPKSQDEKPLQQQLMQQQTTQSIQPILSSSTTPLSITQSPTLSSIMNNGGDKKKNITNSFSPNFGPNHLLFGDYFSTMENTDANDRSINLE